MTPSTDRRYRAMLERAGIVRHRLAALGSSAKQACDDLVDLVLTAMQAVHNRDEQELLRRLPEIESTLLAAESLLAATQPWTAEAAAIERARRIAAESAERA